ncbi:uncharacterized protein zgc:113184 [Betta splendens]|uniref:Uncharacterized protein zgc:113184 n=1 Tax=Betta splendens TaxID=158456 RepID=A0A6P7MM38_BETSP|nr:uncharacterized protein zgc:113184 [Betta splendens]XP_055364931.1 uncharacterized protein zgc:113184 [Betta splendens]
MEEAYAELYQQFLRLRSLCLRQAALLHQLTAALQQQQGTAAPNGELSDMTSIPIQCTQDHPACFGEKPHPLAAAPSAAAQCCIGRLTTNTGAFSDFLAEDMARLSVNMPHQKMKDGALEQQAASLLSLDSSKWPAAQSSESRTAGQADYPGRDRTVGSWRMPLTGSHLLDDDVLNQSGGLLMSDVALQSHTCDFCQAVFPGETTTRGEFLRHLHTHIT